MRTNNTTFIKIIFIAGIFLTVAAAKKLHAQGCSDAGFCSIGGFKHEQINVADSATELSKHHITFTAPAGVGDENVFVFTPGLQYDFSVSSALSLQAKITGNYASGDLGSATGAGDIYLTANYILPHKNKWHAIVTAGAKLPLDKSDLLANNRSLPMQYQSSLGTYDAIAGITITNNNWLFSTAIQQPLSGINNNGYLPLANEAKTDYSPTNLFNRKGDILLRAGKNFNIGKKLLLNAGLLNIYHLGEDEYTNYQQSNTPIAIKGSSGLTVNITAAAWWQIHKKIRIGITGGTPVIVRDVRPDGLTRKFVLAPEIAWSF